MRALFLLLWAAAALAQPPAIDQEGVFNAASHIPPSLPGGGLAPGARIFIKGLRFAADSRVLAGSREARVLSSTPTLIEALLPGELAPGRSQLTVTNRDGASRPFPIRIVPAAPGLYSANGKSWGPALMERPYLLTGTGLGAVRDPEIFAGGKRARLLRAAPKPGAPGIDEIEFALPPDTPAGCHVPVLARIPGGATSNTVSVPVGECREEPVQATAFLLLVRMFNRVRAFGDHPIDFTQDVAAALFAPAEGIAAMLNPWRLRPPEGTCTAYTGPFYAAVDEPTIADFFGGVIGKRGIDAGKVALRTARGAIPIPRDTPGYYHSIIGTDKLVYHTAGPLVLSPGPYTLEWNSGAARLVMPEPFTWSNPGRAATVTRAAGVTVEWKPREPRMAIVAVNVDPDSASMGLCFCVASGGRFTIPPESLANIPATSPEQGLPLSLLIVAPLPDLASVPSGGGASALSLATTMRVVSVDYR